MLHKFNVNRTCASNIYVLDFSVKSAIFHFRTISKAMQSKKLYIKTYGCKMNVYDSYGNLVKTVKNDAFDNSKTNTYDRYGNKQGSTKQDAFNSTRQNITDEYGNVIGYTEIDAFDKDKINKYNKYGNKVGYYKKNSFSGDWEYHKSSY